MDALRHGIGLRAKPALGLSKGEKTIFQQPARWLTVGLRTQQFERDFAEAIGCAHAVAVSLCSAALHLALNAIDLKPGDEVISSTLTFTATGASILHGGARPVLADCTPDTLNLDPHDVVRKQAPQRFASGRRRA